MSKQIKESLKKAREAITNKDYQISLKLCKEILKEEHDNYMALLLLGVSLQETGTLDQATKAFRKAIQINPNNVLAWNGLATHYQKIPNNNSSDELLKIYEKLLDIESSEQKLLELCKKLSVMVIVPENRFKSIVENMMKLAKNETYSKKTKQGIWCSIGEMFSKYSEIPLNLYNNYEEVLTSILEDSQLRTKVYFYQYLTLLHKQKKYEKLFEQAENMHQLYTEDTIPLEWLCKLFNELTIEKNIFASMISNKMENYSRLLLNLQEDSSMGMFTESVLLSEKENYLDAIETLTKVTRMRPGLLHAWVLLASLYLKLYNCNKSLYACIKADKLLLSINNSNMNIRTQLNVLLAESLSRQFEEKKLYEGLQRCSELVTLENPPNPIIYRCIVRCYINLHKYEDAHNALLMLQKYENDYTAFKLLHANLLRNERKLNEALQLLEDDNETKSSDWLLETAILYWDLKQFDKSFFPLLKSAKLNQNCYITFLYLGHYYFKFNEVKKAIRCYEKVINLNKDSMDAALLLSKLYRLQKQWDENILLLENITGNVFNDENQWAWLQLGLTYLEQENYDQAINTLRFLIRKNSTNVECWEALADAYIARGSFLSALKSYQMAIELNPNSLYSLLQISNIKQSLGKFIEAKNDFETILSDNKSYVPALKSISETCLLQATIYNNNQLTGKARDYVQFAIDKLIHAIQQRNDLSCLWKLIGDCCSLVAGFPEKYCYLSNLSFLLQNDDNQISERRQLFSFAERCYLKAISIRNGEICLYYDLAVCFYSRAKFVLDYTEKNQLFNKAVRAVQYCVTANSTNWQYWNLLGVLELMKEPKNYAIAQHAFIKAVTLNNNSAISWSNLGVLYLILLDYKLANKAFAQSQRADPNYINSWIGQALIAEELNSDESMDLFRHSTQLGVHQESAIGYSNWVCNTLLATSKNSHIYSIHSMHAIPIACDSLTWYTENNPDNPCAWNMLGLLKERMGLNNTALDAFRNALRLTDGEHRDKVKINYGRVLFKLTKYNKAVDILKTVSEASFNSSSWLALALFKNKDYEESYNTYEQTLHYLTENESFQSHLLVAMASMAYIFQGPDAAKTLLFQSIKLKSPSFYGFYAILALGLLHNDLHMAKLVLNEIGHLQDNLDCVYHYTFLLSETCLLDGDYNTAKQEISKLIHRHPDQASLWLCQSILLLRLYRNFPFSTKNAGNCAQIAISLGKNKFNTSKIYSIAFLSSYILKDFEEALKVAQKAVHCYPDVAENWVALISALHFNEKKIENMKTLLIQNALEHINMCLNTSQVIIDWLNNVVALKCKNLNH